MEKEVTLRDLFLTLNDGFRYLIKQWILLLAVGVLACLLGVIYAMSKEPEYLATSSFVLEESGTSAGLGQYAGIASAIGFDLGGAGQNGIFQGDNIIELYESRRMIEKTLLSEYDFGSGRQVLIDRYISYHHLEEKWDALLANHLDFRHTDIPLRFKRVRDSLMASVVQDLRKNHMLVIRPDKKLSIINVNVSSSDELFAKVFNDQLVRNVNEFYVATKTKKALRNVEVLQHQADSIRRELNSAISGVATAIDRNPNLNPARQVLRVPSQRRQVDAEANTAILTELVKNLEIAKVSLRRETPLIQLIDEPILPLSKIKVSKLKSGFIAGFLAVFLTGLFLLMKKGYRSIMQ